RPADDERDRGEQRGRQAAHDEDGQVPQQPGVPGRQPALQGRESSLNLKGAPPVTSALVNDGHQYFSMCSTTRSVPAKWFTFGRICELYMVSVMSRISA